MNDLPRYRTLLCLLRPDPHDPAPRAARDLARRHQATLHLACLLAPPALIPDDPGTLGYLDWQLEETLRTQAQHHLQQWGETLGVPPDHRHLLSYGGAALLQLVRERHVDLLVYAHAPGPALLEPLSPLVLRQLPCDFLAIAENETCV